MANGISHVFTLEEGIQSGGFGEAVTRSLGEGKCSCRVYNFAVKDPVVRAASPAEQIKEAGLDAENVASVIAGALGGL